jgi:glyoxylase-like metal-dependent hydrolase (beta-lactamase superfamily II)
MPSTNLRVGGQLTVVALAILAVGAAAKVPETCPTFRATESISPDGVQVRFLGVGGFLISHGGRSIMTPPLYSNPTIGEVAVSDLYPDGERIDRLLHYKVDDLLAIVVGHSHYDHALDIPYISLKRAPKARIYGSQTLLNILNPLVAHWITLRNAEERALCKVDLDHPLDDPCGAGPRRALEVIPSTSPRRRIRPFGSGPSCPSTRLRSGPICSTSPS